MNEHENHPMENLHEGLDQQSELLSAEELEAELQARGIDVQKFLEETKSIIAQYEKDDRLAWMKVADQKKRDIGVTKTQIVSWVGRKASEIQRAFDEFQRTISAETSFAYRNKGDLTIEDMARILDDQQRLQSRCSDDKK